jgi:putative membrane protein
VTTPAIPDATRLAVDRTRLAYERTLMAWVRTATSLISFGFTIYKFFQYLRESQPAPPGRQFGPRELALVMISLGVVSLLLATIEHRRSVKTLRAQFGDIPWSLATILAAIMCLLGLAGLVMVILHK